MKKIYLFGIFAICLVQLCCGDLVTEYKGNISSNFSGSVGMSGTAGMQGYWETAPPPEREHPSGGGGGGGVTGGTGVMGVSGVVAPPAPSALPVVIIENIEILEISPGEIYNITIIVGAKNADAQSVMVDITTDNFNFTLGESISFVTVIKQNESYVFILSLFVRQSLPDGVYPFSVRVSGTNFDPISKLEKITVKKAEHPKANITLELTTKDISVVQGENFKINAEVIVENASANFTLFLYPPKEFRVVEGYLIQNESLPQGAYNFNWTVSSEDVVPENYSFSVKFINKGDGKENIVYGEIRVSPKKEERGNIEIFLGWLGQKKSDLFIIFMLFGGFIYLYFTRRQGIIKKNRYKKGESKCEILGKMDKKIENFDEETGRNVKK